MTLPPLLNHPPAYPEEALPGWLWRLALANHITTPSAILRLLTPKITPQAPFMQQTLANLRDPNLFQALGNLTHTSAQTIYQLTLHRFAHLLTLPNQASERLSLTDGRTLKLLPQQTLSDFYTQRPAWCPLCLFEFPCVRLHWHIPFLTCCTRHRCWLFDTCPVCQQSLSERHIVTRRCEYCGFRLETAAVTAVPEDDLLFSWQVTLVGWLHEIPTPGLGLPNVPVNVLLRTIHGLRFVAQRVGQDWPFHYIPPHIPRPNLDIRERRALTRIERGSLYTTAFSCLIDWPHRFYAFLEAYRQRSTPERLTGLRGEFGSLYGSWMERSWQDPAFDFIRTAFDEYLLTYSQRVQDYPHLSLREDYFSFHETCQHLQVSAHTVNRLTGEGYLPRHTFKNDGGFVWFKRHDVEALQHRWTQYIPFRDVVCQLGISKHLARELITAQLLRVVPADTGVHQDQTYLYQDSLSFLLDDLKPYTTIQTHRPPDHILLVDILNRRTSVKLNFGQLLRRIQAGKLPAYHRRASLLPLAEMWLMRADVENLSQAVKGENDWMTLTEVRSYLGFGRRGFAQFSTLELLQPQHQSGRKHLYSASQVLAFRDQYINASQVGRLLDMSAAHISELVKSGYLKPASGPGLDQFACYLFNREYVLQWKAQYIMYREINGLVPDGNAFMKLLKKRGIRSVMGPPHVYARGAVMNVLSSL
jgi:hypothetical protein